MDPRTSDFDYRLPPHLIAQRPAEPRDQARLLVLHRSDGRMEHRRFADLPEYLDAGDLLVLNETRVLPARLLGRKETGGTRVEVLLVRSLGDGAWEALVHPARRLPPGTAVLLEAAKGALHRVLVQESLSAGSRRVVVPPGLPLEEIGRVPLPPYIHEPLADPERYQTVYARQPGSVAAPTAGLHFTRALLERLQERQVRLARLVLHVGPGTFRPVRAEDPREHDLGAEAFSFPAEAAELVRRTRAEGKRVACIGTTSVRVLETVALRQEVDGSSASLERLGPAEGWTDLFILPGFRFRLADTLVTNFHLPRSTLLMLVAAFAGKDVVDRAYAEAIRQEYRFYSFGDCMLIA